MSPTATSPVHTPAPLRRTVARLLALALMLVLLVPSPAPAQTPEDRPFEGSPIHEVRIRGLDSTSETLVRNNIRTRAGEPLDWEQVSRDIRTLDRLGRFRRTEADVVVDDLGRVSVVFTVEEAPIVEDVLVVGNRQIGDLDIRAVVNDAVRLTPGVPIDDFQIGQAQRAVEELYRERGFYQAQVTVDESELAEAGFVVLRVREGNRIKVTDIRFEGNEAFADRQLRPNIQSKEAGIFSRGPVDDQVLDRDVASLIQFYRDRGYLDVRASRSITPSPDGREAIVTFLVDEGPVYTLRDVRVENLATAGDTLDVFTIEQIRALMSIKRGDVYALDKLGESVDAIRDAYLQLGYVDASVGRRELRDPDQPVVDLLLTVREGERFRTGMVIVRGNELTQQKVIRREVRIEPDRWLDATAAERTEQALRNRGIFKPPGPDAQGPTVTIQPENPDYPGYRDVLVQVEETNTGSISFGAAVNSDAGLAGIVNLRQRNFDIADTPDSFDELIRGRAFRGAGQTFNLLAQPGTEVTLFSLSLSEPYLFESDYAATGEAFFRQREFDDYDEEKFGGRLRFGRRFGERWTGAFTTRVDATELSDIDDDAPVDVFEVEERQYITGLGFELTRTTVDSRFRPTRGTRINLSVEQVGLLGGDFDFTRLTASHAVFLTIDEDFLGRETVLSLETRAGYIPQEDEAPIYERFFLGGRSFRGFDFRGIGPRGIRNDNGRLGPDHVGGDFSFFFGAQVERPVYQDLLAVVGFVDTGVVNDDLSFDDYRVAVGTGVRLYLPQFGQAPLAFDFAFPIVSVDGDDTQVFSFSIDLPF